MSPKGPHPASHSGPRVTTRHPARSIYQRTPPGSHALQHAEYLERCGLNPDPDERLEGFEQDLQDDLAAERRLLPRFPKSLRLRRITTTNNNEKRAA